MAGIHTGELKVGLLYGQSEPGRRNITIKEPKIVIRT